MLDEMLDAFATAFKSNGCEKVLGIKIGSEKVLGTKIGSKLHF